MPPYTVVGSNFISLAGIQGNPLKGYATVAGAATLTAANSGIIAAANPWRKFLMIQNITAGNELAIDLEGTNTIVLGYLEAIQFDLDFPYSGQVRGTPSANSTARYVEMSVQP